MINRNTIINHLAEALRPLPFFYALWLEGADATDTVDAYSDIDFWADVDDANLAQAYEAVENALSSIAPIDYKYVMRHGHPQIEQRVYHLANTSEYLMIDFCWQLSSRPRDEFVYIEGDQVEAVKVLFNKNEVIRYKPLNLADYAQHNLPRLEEAKYRRTQQSRAEKYVQRGQYLEAYAYYNRYVLEPIIDALRLIYTPAHADYYLVHISHHIPAVERERLEYFAQIASLEDIQKRITPAGEWFDDLVKRVVIS